MSSGPCHDLTDCAGPVSRARGWLAFATPRRMASMPMVPASWFGCSSRAAFPLDSTLVNLNCRQTRPHELTCDNRDPRTYFNCSSARLASGASVNLTSPCFVPGGTVHMPGNAHCLPLPEVDFLGRTARGMVDRRVVLAASVCNFRF